MNYQIRSIFIKYDKNKQEFTIYHFLVKENDKLTFTIS